MPERQLAAWLPNSTPGLHAAIVRRALTDVGIVEVPPGSNRSGRIDEYVKAVGSPIASYWCAAALAAWFRECGAALPRREAGSVDAWIRWAKELHLWLSEPAPGRAIIYGKGEDGQHCGVVVRVEPLLLVVEGNTSLDGSADRNGVAVDLKQAKASWILGYIEPVRA